MEGFLAFRWPFSLNPGISEICSQSANRCCTCSFKIPKRTFTMKCSQRPKFDIFVF